MKTKFKTVHGLAQIHIEPETDQERAQLHAVFNNTLPNKITDRHHRIRLVHERNDNGEIVKSVAKNVVYLTSLFFEQKGWYPLEYDGEGIGYIKPDFMGNKAAIAFFNGGTAKLYNLHIEKAEMELCEKNNGLNYVEITFDDNAEEPINNFDPYDSPRHLFAYVIQKLTINNQKNSIRRRYFAQTVEEYARAMEKLCGS